MFVTICLLVGNSPFLAFASSLNCLMSLDSADFLTGLAVCEVLSEFLRGPRRWSRDFPFDLSRKFSLESNSGF
jgi:hypothetical protein